MRYFLLLKLFLLSISSFSQTGDQAIEGEFKIVKSDYLSNIYTLTNENSLQKRDPKGKIICTYNDKSKGIISDFDVSNPLRILAFQADFALINILDNTLSVTSSIDLMSLGYNTGVQFTSSFDNGFWLLDNSSYTLSKYNSSLQSTFKSGNLSQALSFEFMPVEIMESGNYLFINTTENGLLIFDIYGNFVKRINDKITRLHKWKDFIYFKSAGSLCSIDTRSALVECKVVGYTEENRDVIISESLEILLLKDKLVLRPQTF